jgi:hypothetical protein
MPSLEDSEVAKHQVALCRERNVHEPTPGVNGGEASDERVDSVSQRSIAQRSGRVDESRVVGLRGVGHQDSAGSQPGLRREHEVRLT